jgi:hypothetical protein
MARRRPAQRPARGGGRIQALRQARTRVGLASVSGALYGGVTADVIAHSSKAIPATGALAAAGALLLLVALARAKAALVAWPVACLGTAYAIALVVQGRSTDGAAPLVAVGLFLCAELASWSVDERLAIPAERAVVARRATALGALALLALAVAALVVALASAPVGSGLAWTIIGAASAVGVVGSAVSLARRS